MDDDYMKIYEYVGEEKQEYSTAMNISKEEHEMKKMASPQEIQQQTLISQSSTDTHGVQKQVQECAFKITTKGIILTLLIILAVSVSISLAAIVLSILSYNAQKIEQLKIDTNLAISKLTDNVSDFAVQIEDIKSVLKFNEEFNVSQLSTQLDETKNSITSVATTVENITSRLSTQLEETNNSITSVATTVENITSQLSTQLDETNNSITSVATTVENITSQLSTQLHETNNSITSVVTTVEKNVSQLSTRLDAINSSIASVATTAERNITQLSAQLDATNSNIMSVATTLERNISSLFIQLDVVFRFALSVQPEAIGIHCGTGLWYRVANLDMRDPSQQCPSAWREYNINQFRTCGRPVSSISSRPSQIFPVSHQYSKICGRVIGIQVASPDAFNVGSGSGINEVYMDGVSITHGSPRHHIWSYVSSYSEVTTDPEACPCDYSGATQPQAFVGSNYYCESGNPTRDWQGQVFTNDKLWDGEQCSHEGTCCTGTNTPPWFSVTLGSPTSDDIEVRIMGSESTDNEDTPIELLEIYIQ